MTIVLGDPKAPFSIATTPRCRGGHYSFPWIAPLYPWFVPVCWVLSKEVSTTIFNSLVWLNLGLNPGLPDHWRTLYPLDQSAGFVVFQNIRCKFIKVIIIFQKNCYHLIYISRKYFRIWRTILWDFSTQILGVRIIHTKF